ncbi:hypothetical protein [Clostridium celatum]|uniref:hypothetical protein n=1 Tax=Clostridium celatum TaxID=36834 RepID=UPI001898986D|nr:hypothetical protein [Clostridium celatum]
MIKMRLTFVDTVEGRKELDRALEGVKKTFNVINESKVYKGRGNSQYSNIYLDVEEK